jgi:hypothetical protein
MDHTNGHRMYPFGPLVSYNTNLFTTESGINYPCLAHTPRKFIFFLFMKIHILLHKKSLE